jgi:WD40 repeat protein
MTKGEELDTLVGHTGIILVCKYSPDGKYIVSGGADKLVMISLPNVD